MSDVVVDGPTAGVRTLDAEQMFRLVLEPAPAVAVFDCDGTLWAPDAGSGFMQWSIETGLVSREMADWMDVRYRGYLRGEVGEEAICGEMVQLYQGLREEEMRRAARMFVAEHIEPGVFAEMREVAARLRAGGAELWAVSSSNRWVIDEGVRPFGIAPQRVLAARVRVSNGVLTNELEAVPTDELKARALRVAGIGHPDVVFGNSVHDAAMLAMAARPVAVNPSEALRAKVTGLGWPIFQPEDQKIRLP